MSIVDDIRGTLAPPHPAGRPFILGGIIAILFGVMVGTWLVWLGLLWTAFCLFFFRDPERVAPRLRGLVLSASAAAPTSICRWASGRWSWRDKPWWVARQ